jgi:hypothetical protein
MGKQEQGEYAKGLETGLIAGINHERERIVTLLQDAYGPEHGAVKEIIALIEGEPS